MILDVEMAPAFGNSIFPVMFRSLIFGDFFWPGLMGSMMSASVSDRLFIFLIPLRSFVLSRFTDTFGSDAIFVVLCLLLYTFTFLATRPSRTWYLRLSNSTKIPRSSSSVEMCARISLLRPVLLR